MNKKTLKLRIKSKTAADKLGSNDKIYKGYNSVSIHDKEYYKRLDAVTPLILLFLKMTSSSSPASSSYDKDFAAWARSKGYGLDTSSIAKQAIKDYYEANGKFPAKGHKLRSKLDGYCSPSSDDKDFAAWARSLRSSRGRPGA